jgi:hypothetical protein
MFSATRHPSRALPRGLLMLLLSLGVVSPTYVR